MMLRSDLVRGYNLSWKVWGFNEEDWYFIPCKLTGNLDRTAGGNLHAGNSVEIEFPGGFTIWVRRTDIFGRAKEQLSEKSILETKDL